MVHISECIWQLHAKGLENKRRARTVAIFEYHIFWIAIIFLFKRRVSFSLMDKYYHSGIVVLNLKDHTKTLWLSETRGIYHNIIIIILSRNRLYSQKETCVDFSPLYTVLMPVLLCISYDLLYISCQDISQK